MNEKKPTVMLDAGHYGKYNQSPFVADYWESERMWELHLLLKSALERYGITVLTTREEQSRDLSVVERGAMSKGCDLFLSLHSNAVGYGGRESVDRIEVYAAYDNQNNSHELAAKLAGSIAEVMEVSDGGHVKTRKSDKGDWEYYGVLRGARAAGCPLYYIIEHSFHTNKRAADWLMSYNNLKRLAKAEAAVIAEYFGLETEFLSGDVNGDGFVDELDYVLIKRAVMGNYELTEAAKKAADVNNDGAVDEFDYIAVRRMVMG